MGKLAKNLTKWLLSRSLRESTPGPHAPSVLGWSFPEVPRSFCHGETLPSRSGSISEMSIHGTSLGAEEKTNVVALTWKRQHHAICTNGRLLPTTDGTGYQGGWE